MPVTLEQVGIINKSDKTDLEKIYQDYPKAISFTDIAKFIEGNGGSILFAARFNAKLLGALTLNINGNTATIDHLCVRRITRERHVARDLLRLLLQKFPKLSFQFESCIESDAVTALFKQAGFTPSGNTFTHSSND